jgi:hypothetical protein
MLRINNEISYFAIAVEDGNLKFTLFDAQPEVELLGKVTLESV